MDLAMRDSIKRLEPEVHESPSGRRYVRLDVGRLSRVEAGGYKLEGGFFATADTREGMLQIFDQVMERLDESLASELGADE
jgi:hypothetical protein